MYTLGVRSVSDGLYTYFGNKQNSRIYQIHNMPQSTKVSGLENEADYILLV